MSYTYNSVGQMAGVSGTNTYVNSASYNPAGQLTQLVQPGITRQRVYESNTLRLSVVKAGTNSTDYDDRQKLTYSYDNAGNVTSVTDAINSSQVQSFGYDWLDRLVTASTNAVGTGQYNHTYAYNATGNITSYAGNSYTYSSSQPQAVTAAFGNSYGYDAVGNQTSRTVGGVVYTLVYDYENRLVSMSGGSVSATFVYDADGNRVKGTVNGVTTVYIGGVYEYSGGAAKSYYSGPGGVVAMRSGGTVFYLLNDQLNSTARIVNSAGAVQSTQYYYPFGGNRGGAFSTLTTKRFTGQYHESTLPGGEELYYYGARWYDAYLNQWIQPDTIVPDMGNGADYNRYSYVRNNPLRYKDDTGHTPWDVIDVGFWVWSAKDFLQDPTWANAGWLALDTVSLLPLIPSAGYLTRGGRLFVNLSADAVTHSDELVRLASRLQNSIPMGRTLNEISANSLETVHRYGIDRAGRLNAPTGHDVHHLVEKRFSEQLGFASKGQGEYNILGVIVDNESHRLAQDSITRQLQQEIGYGKGTQNASPQDIWNAHKKVYTEADHADWAELIWEVYFQHIPDIVK